MRMIFSTTGYCLIFAAALFFGVAFSRSNNSKTLVVAFDGFGQVYFDGNRFLPWFEQFRRVGVYSDAVKSVFPSETFPNFYAIATGLYPESHGIVSNTFYDAKLSRSFNLNETDSVFWNAAEPLWITARRLGVTKTATSGWPGGDVVLTPENLTATYAQGYDVTVPFRKRVDYIVDLMANQDVGLGFLYHIQPDWTGHSKGTNGSSMANELMRTDWLLSYVLLATERAGLGQDKLNIILCSDHGMTDFVREILIEDYINVPTKIQPFSRSGGFAAVWPKPGQDDSVYQVLKQAANKSNGVWDVWRKNEFPSRFHYQNNDRISPITITSSLGTYVAVMRSQSAERYGYNVGLHGYDPDLREMRPIFMARGPSFKRNYNATADTAGMETKDLYALIANLIGLEASQQPANNASIKFFANMLVERPQMPDSASSLKFLTISTTALLALIHTALFI